MSLIMGFPVAAVLEAEKAIERLRRCTTHEQVLDAMTGVSIDAFRFLDEKPGYFGDYAKEDWHMLLRQVRNDDNDLFDRLAR